MKLNFDRKSKDPTYFIQQGFRNGKKTTTKNIARIGKRSELLAKGIKDPEAYARDQVAALNKKIDNEKVPLTLELDFSKKVPYTGEMASASTLLNIGYFYLQAIYQKLELKKFFFKTTEGRKIAFDPNEINRFLTYAQILNPASKLKTIQNLNCFYEKPSFTYKDMERTLDILSDNFDEYITNLYEKSSKIVNIDDAVTYFDCTNYYFEIESEDPDYIDEVTGEVIKGFRKYAVSKEHRPNPVVEMGLFIDKQGIPISMCIADSGSDNEQTLAIPNEKKILKRTEGKPFIYCADAGLSSLDIRKFNSMGGRTFIVTQSIKKLSSVLQEAVFNEADYKLLSCDEKVSVEAMKKFDRFDKKNRSLYDDKAYKIITADHAVDTGLTETKILKNGKKKVVKSDAVLKQNVIITFSRKAMEYQRHVRNGQIERAKRLLKNMDPEKYKKGPNDVTRFIKKAKKTEKSDYVLDVERIAAEEKYDGYYAIATNLMCSKNESKQDYVRKVLEINGSRYKVEECFRLLKTDFGSRPARHHLKNRITAHFMICYTALLIYRILEVQMNQYGARLKEPEHYTTDHILTTIRNMQVTNVQDICYQSTYTESKALNALEGVYSLGINCLNYRPYKLNKVIRKLI